MIWRICSFSESCFVCGFVTAWMTSEQFTTVRSSIVTNPKNTLAFLGSRVVLDCSTDLEYPMNWAHTPAGSDKSTEFYFLEGFLQTNEFYKSGFQVDTSKIGHYTLIIDNASARHAGRYDCLDNEGYTNVKTSADLNVIENSLECEYANSIDLSYTIVTCNISMTGNLEPKLECEDDQQKKSSASVFDSYDRGIGKHYLSTNASLQQTIEETDLTCSIRLNDRSPPQVSKQLKVKHAKTQGGDDDDSTILLLDRRAFLLMLVIPLGIIFWLIVHKYNQCKLNPSVKASVLGPSVTITSPADTFDGVKASENSGKSDDMRNQSLHYSNEKLDPSISPTRIHSVSSGSSGSSNGSTDPLLQNKSESHEV